MLTSCYIFSNSVKKAITDNLGEKFGPEIIDKNIKALGQAYQSVEI